MNSEIGLRQLACFVAVAEDLHFGRAAQRLNIAQPPLSQQIARLEKNLGCRLFHRTSRHAELTEAGQVLLQFAKPVLAHVDRALDETRRAARGETGSLSVGFPASLSLSFLPRLVSIHRKRYPEVSLRLNELVTTSQLQALAKGTIDIGFLREMQPESRTFVTELVLEERLVALLPRSHPLATHSRLPLSAMAKEGFVLFPRAAGPEFYDKIVSACQSAGFQPRVIQEAVEWHSIVALVGAGIGVSLTPESIRRLRWPSVVCRTITPGVYSTKVFLCFLRGKISPIMQNFVSLVREISPKHHPDSQRKQHAIGSAREK